MASSVRAWRIDVNVEQGRFGTGFGGRRRGRSEAAERWVRHAENAGNRVSRVSVDDQEVPALRGTQIEFDLTGLDDRHLADLDGSERRRWIEGRQFVFTYTPPIENGIQSDAVSPDSFTMKFDLERLAACYKKVGGIECGEATVEDHDLCQTHLDEIKRRYATRR